MQILEFRQTQKEGKRRGMSREWQPIYEMDVRGFGETGHVAIMGKYIGTIENEMHT